MVKLRKKNITTDFNKSKNNQAKDSSFDKNISKIKASGDNSSTRLDSKIKSNDNKNFEYDKNNKKNGSVKSYSPIIGTITNINADANKQKKEDVKSLKLESSENIQNEDKEASDSKNKILTSNRNIQDNEIGNLIQLIPQDALSHVPCNSSNVNNPVDIQNIVANTTINLFKMIQNDPEIIDKIIPEAKNNKKNKTPFKRNTAISSSRKLNIKNKTFEKKQINTSGHHSTNFKKRNYPKTDKKPVKKQQRNTMTRNKKKAHISALQHLSQSNNLDSLVKRNLKNNLIDSKNGKKSPFRKTLQTNTIDSELFSQQIDLMDSMNPKKLTPFIQKNEEESLDFNLKCETISDNFFMNKDIQSSEFVNLYNNDFERMTKTLDLGQNNEFTKDLQNHFIRMATESLVIKEKSGKKNFMEKNKEYIRKKEEQRKKMLEKQKKKKTKSVTMTKSRKKLILNCPVPSNAISRGDKRHQMREKQRKEAEILIKPKMKGVKMNPKGPQIPERFKTKNRPSKSQTLIKKQESKSKSKSKIEKKTIPKLHLFENFEDCHPAVKYLTKGIWGNKTLNKFSKNNNKFDIGEDEVIQEEVLNIEQVKLDPLDDNIEIKETNDEKVNETNELIKIDHGKDDIKNDKKKEKEKKIKKTKTKIVEKEKIKEPIEQIEKKEIPIIKEDKIKQENKKKKNNIIDDKLDKKKINEDDKEKNTILEIKNLVTKEEVKITEQPKEIEAPKITEISKKKIMNFSKENTVLKSDFKNKKIESKILTNIAPPSKEFESQISEIEKEMNPNKTPKKVKKKKKNKKKKKKENSIIESFIEDLETDSFKKIDSFKLSIKKRRKKLLNSSTSSISSSSKITDSLMTSNDESSICSFTNTDSVNNSILTSNLKMKKQTKPSISEINNMSNRERIRLQLILNESQNPSEKQIKNENIQKTETENKKKASKKKKKSLKKISSKEDKSKKKNKSKSSLKTLPKNESSKSNKKPICQNKAKEKEPKTQTLILPQPSKLENSKITNKVNKWSKKPKNKPPKTSKQPVNYSKPNIFKSSNLINSSKSRKQSSSSIKEISDIMSENKPEEINSQPQPDKSTNIYSPIYSPNILSQSEDFQIGSPELESSEITPIENIEKDSNVKMFEIVPENLNFKKDVNNIEKIVIEESLRISENEIEKFIDNPDSIRQQDSFIESEENKNNNLEQINSIDGL